MKKIYMFYFNFSVISALIISMTLILDSAINIMEKKKEKLVAESRNLEKYIQEEKKLENILKKIKLRIYKKHKANNILIMFLENLKRNYDSKIKSITEKKGLIEAEVKININFSKEELKKLLSVLTKSTNPVVYIEEFKLTDREKFIKIKIYQPYWEI